MGCCERISICVCVWVFVRVRVQLCVKVRVCHCCAFWGGGGEGAVEAAVGPSIWAFVRALNLSVWVHPGCGAAACRMRHRQVVLSTPAAVRSASIASLVLESGVGGPAAFSFTGHCLLP